MRPVSGKYGGRLVFCAVTAVHTSKIFQGDLPIYSDDGGRTFNFSRDLHVPSTRGLDECNIAQAANGSLFLIARNNACANRTNPVGSACRSFGEGRLVYSRSDNGGESWTRPLNQPQLENPRCQGSIISYRGRADKVPALYFSGPYSTTTRFNGSILASDDNGVTFTRSLLLWPGHPHAAGSGGGFGYTGLACGLPGKGFDCAILFDQDEPGLWFLPFDSADVVARKDSPAPQKTLCEAATTTLPNETILYRAHTHGYFNYLNPALLKASDSVVLAFAEARKGTGGDSDAIDIVVRRSTDGGLSFGDQTTIVSKGDESCLCIVPVLTPKTKDVLVVFECERKCVRGVASQRMSAIRSSDAGESWTAPEEIAGVGYVYGGPGPANGITTSSGRIIITYQVTTLCPSEWNNATYHNGFDGQTCVILSDDDGQHFRKGGCIPKGPAQKGFSEGQAAQLLEDGAILLASRLYERGPDGCRHWSTSKDLGNTFSADFVVNDTGGVCLPDPKISDGCEASLLSLASQGSKRMYYASPIDGGTNRHNVPEGGRINLTLFSAEIGNAEEARTVGWTKEAQIAPSQSEYSSMIVLDNMLAIIFVDGRGANEQGPNCGAGCCGRLNNTIRMTKYSLIKTDDPVADRPPPAYSVVWDSWWPLQCYSFCHSDPPNVNLSSFGIKSNGNGNGSMSVAHGRALTLWDSSLGLYPHWTCPKFPDPESCANTSVNGGVPQLAVLNLSAHIAKLKLDIDNANGCATCGTYSLDPDFDGLGVLDWEFWDFAWSRMKLGGWDASNDIRVNTSIALVLADHPGMPLDQAEVEAGKRWDVAVKSFIEATLAALHKLRPKGKFGFFGYPDCGGHRAAPGEPLGCSASFRAVNDNELGWLWSTSSALYPSYYVSTPGQYPRANVTHQSNQAGVDVSVAEAVRVADFAPVRQRPQIFLYGRASYYHEQARAWSQNESGLLQQPDLETTIARPAAHGIDGVVLWGASADCESTQGGRTCTQKCEDQSMFIQSSLGPSTLKVITRATECAAKNCPHGGRCVTIDANGEDLDKPKCTASTWPVSTDDDLTHSVVATPATTSLKSDDSEADVIVAAVSATGSIDITLGALQLAVSSTFTEPSGSAPLLRALGTAVEVPLPLNAWIAPITVLGTSKTGWLVSAAAGSYRLNRTVTVKGHFVRIKDQITTGGSQEPHAVAAVQVRLKAGAPWRRPRFKLDDAVSWWVQPATLRVRLTDTKPPDGAATTIDIAAQRGECERQFVVVYHSSSAISNLSVSFSAVPAAGSQWSYRQQGYIWTHRQGSLYAPVKHNFSARWIAEPLLNVPHAGIPFVPAKTPQAILVQVCVPTSAEPGNYTLSAGVSMSIGSDNFNFSVPISMQVWPILLPPVNKHSLGIQMNFIDDLWVLAGIWRGYKADCYPLTDRRCQRNQDWYTFMMQHRMPPSPFPNGHLPSTVPTQQLLSYAEAGSQVIVIRDVSGRPGTNYTSTYIENELAILAPQVGNLTAAGYGDRLVVYGFGRSNIFVSVTHAHTVRCG
jgi:hyaluronoglucosaminidase